MSALVKNRQNILLNSAGKSILTELNNDISLRFPNKLFYKSPQSLELLYLNLEYDVTLFGNTNNQFNLLITLSTPNIIHQTGVYSRFKHETVYK